MDLADGTVEMLSFGPPEPTAQYSSTDPKIRRGFQPSYGGQLRCRRPLRRTPTVAGAAAAEAKPKRGGGPSFTLGPKDSLEGKLNYEGYMRVEGRLDGEVHVTGDIEIAQAATVTASIEASGVCRGGNVQGTVTARSKLTLSGSGKLIGDVHVAKLQVSDGASLNGNVRMGGFE